MAYNLRRLEGRRDNHGRLRLMSDEREREREREREGGWNLCDIVSDGSTFDGHFGGDDKQKWTNRRK